MCRCAGLPIVLSAPIPPRLLRAAHRQLVTPVPQVVHRVITRHLLGQAGPKAFAADSVAVTRTQRIGSAANLNFHLHCLVLASPASQTGTVRSGKLLELTLETQTAASLPACSARAVGCFCCLRYRSTWDANLSDSCSAVNRFGSFRQRCGASSR